jgi:WhiB family redox-sensing transcriptional regulator
MIDLDAAACRNRSGLFHPEPGDDDSIQAARRVCARCPIRLECLTLALATPTATGIWGGLTDDERARHRRRDVEHQPCRLS